MRQTPRLDMVGLTLIKDAELFYMPNREPGGNILVSEAFIDMGRDIDIKKETEYLVQRLSMSGAAGVIDAASCVAVPGLVDLHVHICGGGGEAGMPLLTHTFCVLPSFLTLATACRAPVRPANLALCVHSLSQGIQDMQLGTSGGYPLGSWCELPWLRAQARRPAARKRRSAPWWMLA